MFAGMGEQTKYDSMTAAQLAATLTTAMVEALDDGRDNSSGPIATGRHGTTTALRARGLIDGAGYWTKRGYEVAALVLAGGPVPAYVEPKADADAHVPVAGVPGTSLGEMREAFVVRHYMGDDLLDACGSADRDVQLVATPVVEDVTCTPCGRIARERAAKAERRELDGYYDAGLTAVRTSAVELLTDGSQVPVGVPRETTISREALDALIEPESAPVAQAEMRQLDGYYDAYDVQQVVGRLVRRAQYLALRKMLDVLSGWMEGAASNHEALGHRDSDCCRDFHPDDIRRMVADAARELGTADPS